LKPSPPPASSPRPAKPPTSPRAAFRLGWDAAILIARARLADELLARALTGHEEVIHKDPDAHQIT